MVQCLGTPDVSGIVALGFRQREGGAERWSGLLSTPQNLISLRLLRRCTYAGLPFGDEAFVETLEQRFQRSWRRWSLEAAPAPETLAVTR